MGIDKNTIDTDNPSVCCGYTTFVEYLNDAMFPSFKNGAYYFEEENPNKYSRKIRVNIPRNNCVRLKKRLIFPFHTAINDNPDLMEIIEGFRKEVFKNNLKYGRNYVNEVERLFCVSWINEPYIDKVLPNLQGMYDAMAGGTFVLKSTMETLEMKKIRDAHSRLFHAKALIEITKQIIGNYIEISCNNLKSTTQISNIEGVEEKKVKTFIEYLSHTQSEKFAESLKNEFKFEKGKSIKLLITTLENKLILILGEREMKNFYEAMKKYFERDIGTYQSINDFKYSKNSHKKDLDSINIRVEKVIKEHENQENSL